MAIRLGRVPLLVAMALASGCIRQPDSSHGYETIECPNGEHGTVMMGCPELAHERPCEDPDHERDDCESPEESPPDEPAEPQEVTLNAQFVDDHCEGIPGTDPSVPLYVAVDRFLGERPMHRCRSPLPCTQDGDCGNPTLTCQHNQCQGETLCASDEDCEGVGTCVSSIRADHLRMQQRDCRVAEGGFQASELRCGGIPTYRYRGERRAGATYDLSVYSADLDDHEPLTELTLPGPGGAEPPPCREDRAYQRSLPGFPRGGLATLPANRVRLRRTTSGTRGTSSYGTTYELVVDPAGVLDRDLPFRIQPFRTPLPYLGRFFPTSRGELLRSLELQRGRVVVLVSEDASERHVTRFSPSGDGTLICQHTVDFSGGMQLSGTPVEFTWRRTAVDETHPGECDNSDEGWSSSSSLR